MRAAAAAALLVLVVGATGCSDDGGAGPAVRAPAPTPTGASVPRRGSPAWRPDLIAGEELGVDVSVHQGTIAWPRVAADGVSFAYVKASEGGDHADTRHDVNLRGARAAGLDVGSYHFFTLCRPGADQAANFLRAAPPSRAEGVLAPAVDLELVGNCADRPDLAAVDREVDAFLGAVERAWRRPVVLYVGADWTRRYPSQAAMDRPQWVRRIHRRPPTGGWAIWQVHATAHVSGIDGPVDLDVRRVDD